MENREIEIIEIDNKRYGVISEFDNLVFTANLNDVNDIKVFKTIKENEEEYLEELYDDEKEIAFIKFYEKNKKTIDNESNNC